MTKKVVVDIETILDAEAVARARFDPDEAFAPFPLHALACVSLLVIVRDAMARSAYSIHSFARDQLSERAIIASVERVLSDSCEVVTFNGRGFDVPVLMTRVALTGEYAPTIARLRGEATVARVAAIAERARQMLDSDGVQSIAALEQEPYSWEAREDFPTGRSLPDLPRHRRRLCDGRRAHGQLFRRM